MRKILTYSIFGITSIGVILLFLTATNYIQLVIAIISYPVLAYFALNLFKRPQRVMHPTSISNTDHTSSVTEPEEDVADVDKRAFLKLVGAAGISLFLFSFFGKRGGGIGGGIPFLNTKGESGTESLALTDSSGAKINPAEKKPMDGYQITEIDDNLMTYYGFINEKGAWVIMREDTDTTSFRYAKGDGDFPGNWSNREKLQYDYFHNVFKTS